MSTSTLVYTSDTLTAQRQREAEHKRREHADRVLTMICAADDARIRKVTGKCTACGAVEVILDNPVSTTDLSDIGESSRYPIGYGCEVCS